MSKSPWAVSFERRAGKDLERLDRKLRRRVVEAVERLAEDPDAGTRLRRLKGRSEHRLRVGEWRVLLQLDRQAHTLVVVRVLPRGRAYNR